MTMYEPEPPQETAEQKKRREDAIRCLHDWLPVFCLGVLTLILFCLGYGVDQGRVCAFNIPAYNFHNPNEEVSRPSYDSGM